MPGERLDQKTIEKVWNDYLTTGNNWRYLGPFKYRDFRALMRWLPKDPRCRICYTPFSGVGGKLIKMALGRERSVLNPNMCNICDKFAREYQGGAEVEISMLFADVRGSTTLAEGMAPIEFSRLINRFYRAVTDILVESDAWIEKLFGDEVTGLFIPGFTGPQHARLAVEAAQAILRATGHGSPEGAWIPVGVGVHTGTAFVGAVGKEGGMIDIIALGDAVNTAARLAANAGPGEILVSEQAWNVSGLGTELGAEGAEVRQLQIKGRSEPVGVRILRAVYRTVEG
jgi:adenylate cyclase